MSDVSKTAAVPPHGIPFLGYWSVEWCTMPGYYVATLSERGYTAHGGDLYLGCAPDRWWPLPPAESPGAEALDLEAIEAAHRRDTDGAHLLLDPALEEMHAHRGALLAALRICNGVDQ